MRSIFAVFVAVLGLACGDAFAPPVLNQIPLQIASAERTTWQCSTAPGVVAIEVAQGAYDTTVVAAPEGHVVTQVAIKTGSDCTPTPPGATGTVSIEIAGLPCAIVDGLGTQAASVHRIGTSPECRNVTHVEYVSAEKAREPETGFLQVCKAISFDNGLAVFLTVPFTYVVADTTLTLGEAGAFAPPLMCAEPLPLAAGEYSITESPKRIDVIAHATTLPADRLVSADMSVPGATIRVVTGAITVLTFHALVDADGNDLVGGNGLNARP